MPPRENENEKDDKKKGEGMTAITFPYEFKLTRPVHGHGGETSSFELREPSAEDLIEMRTAPITLTYLREGVGATMKQETRFEERYDLFLILAIRLTGRDEMFFKDMSAKDYRKLCTLMGQIWRETEGE